MKLTLAWAILVSSALLAGQQTTVGDFTKSPTEHFINQIETPFVVRSVSGTVRRQAEPSGEPLRDVLFEIQGPQGARTIRSATSDKNGKFRITGIPAGVYRFKATLNGFQSVMGTVEVSKKAPKASDIQIALQIGA